MSYHRATYFGVAVLFLMLVSFAVKDGYFDAPVNDLQFALEQFDTTSQSAIGSPEGDNVERGAVRVIDGASFEFVESQVKVRLSGVQSCDPHQLASYRGTPWPCGTVATAWLVTKTLGQTVECQILLQSLAAYKLARCGIAGHDLAVDALSNGHAIIDGSTSKGVPLSTYTAIQNQARDGEVGLWSSIFTEPKVWRKDRASDRSSQVRQIKLQ